MMSLDEIRSRMIGIGFFIGFIMIAVSAFWIFGMPSMSFTKKAIDPVILPPARVSYAPSPCQNLIFQYFVTLNACR